MVSKQGEARVGAIWLFDMIAPNGHRYDNRMEFLEVVPNEKLVLDHGTNKENDPNLARS